MIPYPNIDPDIIKIGPIAIRWYGLMYICGFVSSYLLVKYQIAKRRLEISDKDIESLYSWLIFSMIIGARLGYVIFYNSSYYLKNILEIPAIWQGGLSFHGGLIGGFMGGLFFCSRRKLNFIMIADMVIVTVPIGLGLGRLGNFINGELFGRISDVPWAMIFPSGGLFPRHPSQLYEMFFEGFLLFGILWHVKDKQFRNGTCTGLFLILYGLFRSFVELFREPDLQVGFMFNFLTMGQILSGFMILFGSGLLIYVRYSLAVDRYRDATC